MILRQVQARKTLANGTVERRNCQVVVGRLQCSNSFGEVSILDDQPMTCTVVTETPVELGVIDEGSLNALDDDTRKLIRQSSKPTFGEITQVIFFRFFRMIENRKEGEGFFKKLFK